jgi:peptidoglycan/LPS O-acetylase OafA/YrhL
MEKSKYIRGVDGLRAIAVLTVVLFHAGFSAFSGGFVGVDVFFVISGFLITRLVADEVASTGRFDFGNFYVRRARRLFPALFTTSVACLVVAFFLFTPEHFQRFGGELLYASVSLANIFFWSEAGYFDTSSDFKPLLHTWSLSVEEQFYLIWPALLLLLLRKTGKRGVWVCLILVAALSLYANFRFQNGFNDVFISKNEWLAKHLSNGESTIFFLTPFRIFEFMFGASLVWLKPCFKVSRLTLELAMAVGLVLIAYAVFQFDQNTIFPTYNALVPCFGAAMVILAVDAPVLGVAVRNRGSVALGLISYSVYLVHWPILVFFKYWHMTPIDTGERVALVIVSLIAGSLLYRFVETPFRNPKAARLSKGGVGFACSSLLLALATVASTIWANDGFPWRSLPLPSVLEQQVETSQNKYGGDGFPEPTAWINETPTGRADIVVIGDSHAGQYKTGLKQLIGDPYRRSVFFSTASCLIMPGMSRFTPETDWDRWCTEAMSTALSVLKRSPDATVVLAEAWSFQLVRAASLEGHRRLYDGRNFDAAIEQMTPYLDAFRKAVGNRPILLVGEVPGAGVQDSIGCFRRPKYLNFSCDRILSTPEQTNPAQRVNRFLQAYASQHEGMSFVSPFTALCDGTRCRTFQDGMAVYSDQFHLSKFGSKLVVDSFKTKLLGVPPSSPQRNGTPQKGFSAYHTSASAPL